MRHNVYTIYDQASAFYMRIFQARGHGEVLRAFSDMAMNKDHDIGAHPEHYSLWFIGTFDDNTGELVRSDFECLGKAHEIVAASRKVDPDKMKELEAEVVQISAGGTD